MGVLSYLSLWGLLGFSCSGSILLCLCSLPPGTDSRQRKPARGAMCGLKEGGLNNRWLNLSHSRDRFAGMLEWSSEVTLPLGSQPCEPPGQPQRSPTCLLNLSSIGLVEQQEFCPPHCLQTRMGFIASHLESAPEDTASFFTMWSTENIPVPCFVSLWKKQFLIFSHGFQ